ncbi:MULTISPECIES: hypothetical protein [unclassified Imperialibacter]|uniref:hypothetical protein n=1 Tax=unclassified Imperialibacter TaxID=2629706 RepID=UPI00125F8238|nr:MULTISPECIES: hypothetical protein [unclassified Imperialibacter]
MKNQRNTAEASHGYWKIVLTIAMAIFSLNHLMSQSAKHTILVDVAHGQKFYNNPNKMNPSAGSDAPRVEYLIGELSKNAGSLGTQVGFLNGAITPAQLAKCDLLFIHIPSSTYSNEEVKAITDYVSKGGSLFLVMEEDYWSTLRQTNTNDLIRPFGIQFGENSTDSLSGGFTKPTPVIKNPLKVTYHGGRVVKGGTPFCFNSQTKEPFGVFTTLKSGGKVIAMGDGMTPLYMTSWNGVDDYQCSEFMGGVLGWLLE